MELKVVNMNGRKVDTVELPEKIFGAKINIDLMHQAYVRQMANARLGTHNTKTRGEVRGGGRKPWKQKGTGRARQGTTRAPQWVGGGTVFGPTPRSYAKRMPRKMRQAALRSALSVKAVEEEIIVVKKLELAEVKTNLMAQALKALVGDGSVLIVIPEKSAEYDVIEKSARNLPDAKTILVNYINIRDLLSYDKLILPLQALDAITDHLG